MRSKKSKILSFFLVLVMSFAMFSQVAMAEEAKGGEISDEGICNLLKDDGEEIKESPNVDYYGRNALASLSNSTALLYAYDQIVAGVENADEKIIIYNGTNAISRDEIKVVIDAYKRDYTQHFWFGSDYSVTYNTNTIVSVKPKYTVTGRKLKYAKIEFNEAVDEILSGITASMSEYEKELYIHDAISKNVAYEYGYDKDDINVHNAYGALVEGKAVCDGYAGAFQYLLQCVGIQSFIAEGSSVNPGTNAAEDHAWNYVRIDGNYYHVDLTWDDQEEDLYHAYFNQTDAVMNEDHVIANAAYALPVCDSDSKNYFNNKDVMLTTYTVTSVAKLLKDNNMSVHVYIPEDKNDFIKWYVDHILDIATEAGIVGSFNYSYISLGKEIILSIDKICDHESLTLISAKEATCTEAGLTEGKLCSVCNEVLVEQEVIEATGHTEVVDNAESATCTKDGLTEGSHCSVCNAVLVEQEVISALGHTLKVVGAKEATDSEDGYTGDTVCEVCEKTIESGQVIPATGLKEGWLLKDGNWYYYKNYVMQTGWLNVGGIWYYLDESGVMQTGWILDGNAWYYLNAGGIMQTGWVLDGGNWYYLNAGGIMQTGWVLTGGNWYYLNAGGIMQTGWVLTGGNWYYLSAGGIMQTGWVLTGGNWYYLNAGGIMQTGWVLTGGNWYYLNAGGIMQTGWVLTGGNWYYLNTGGIMQTGWQYISGTWYYFYNSGVMATGRVNIGGTVYSFNASGAWIG